MLLQSHSSVPPPSEHNSTNSSRDLWRRYPRCSGPAKENTVEAKLEFNKQAKKAKHDDQAGRDIEYSPSQHIGAVTCCGVTNPTEQELSKVVATVERGDNRIHLFTETELFTRK